MSHRGTGRRNDRNNNRNKSSLSVSSLCRTDRSNWVNYCRQTLLDMETRNIHRRANEWTKLVNDKVVSTNRRLNFDSSIFANNVDKFQYSVDDKAMEKHLNFIISWKGLKTRQIQNAPKTYIEFEHKAKNWLNGRRAPNYAATLFPDMIKAAEIYADYVSRQIFSNNPSHSKTYCKICIIGFLSALCSARISLNDASKKAYLICENSVKTGKTQVSQILQRYASDHQYPDKFPSHLREASDFFENKYMDLVSDFGIALNQQKQKEKLNKATRIGGAVFREVNNETNTSGSDASTFHDTRSDDSSASGSEHHHPRRDGLPPSITPLMNEITNCDGGLNAISMSIDQFNKLATFLSSMIDNQRTQQSTISDLVKRVSTLETQQKCLLNDMDANNSKSHSPTASTQSSRTRNTLISQGYASNNSVGVINGNININGNMTMTRQQQQQQQQQQQMNLMHLQQQQQQLLLQQQQPHLLQLPFSNPHLNAFESTASSSAATVHSMNHMNMVQNIQQQNMRQLAAQQQQQLQLQQQQQRQQNLPNNGTLSPHSATTNSNTTISNNGSNQRPQSQQQQQRRTDGPYIGNMVNMNMAQQMNHVTNLHNLPQITPVINMNGNGSSNKQTSLSNNNLMDNINNNNNQSMLPNTMLIGGSTGGSDTDFNMNNYLNNQSFTSSDAGMTGMLSVPNANNHGIAGISNSSNSQIPLEGGYMHTRFSDNSLNLTQQPTIANITNISNIAVYNQPN